MASRWSCGSMIAGLMPGPHHRSVQAGGQTARIGADRHGARARHLSSPRRHSRTVNRRRHDTPPEIATALPAAPAGKVDTDALAIVPGAPVARAGPRDAVAQASLLTRFAAEAGPADGAGDQGSGSRRDPSLCPGRRVLPMRMQSALLRPAGRGSAGFPPTKRNGQTLYRVRTAPLNIGGGSRCRAGPYQRTRQPTMPISSSTSNGSSGVISCAARFCRLCPVSSVAALTPAAGRDLHQRRTCAADGCARPGRCCGRRTAWRRCRRRPCPS